MIPHVQPILEYINGLPIGALMLTVTLGYLLGRLKWRGMSLGPAGGTLFVALALGALGLELNTGNDSGISIGMFGFALFIYSIGFEAGPGFFSGIRGGHGLRHISVGITVAVFSVALAIGAGYLFDFDASTTAGVLSGALTSASTYAAASEEAADNAHLAIAFALTYPFGLVGLVFMIQLIPRLAKTDLESEGDNAADNSGRTLILRRGSPELTRAFRVEQPDVCDKPLKELHLTRRTGCFITRIHHKDNVLPAHAESILTKGDHILVTGRLDELQVFEGLVGPEVYDSELRHKMPPARRIQVLNRGVAGKTLKELNVLGRAHCIIMRIERAGQIIEPGADVTLQHGDTIEVVGKRANVRSIAKEFGRFEPSTTVTNIAVYAAGILAGVLLGGIHFSPFGMDLSLDHAGGLLLAGLLLGRLRNVRFLSANVPAPARQLVRDLGILLFLSETGVASGHALMDGAVDLNVPMVLVSGAVVTIVPVILALLASHYVWKLKPLESWGSVCGGMTSSAALTAVKRASDSNEPAISYAAAFAVASVLVTVAGQFVIRVMA